MIKAIPAISTLAAKMPVTAWVALLLTFYFVMAATSLIHFDGTYDEGGHWEYGFNILNGNAERFDDSKMPVSTWNAWPRWLGVKFFAEGSRLRETLTSLNMGRVPTILAALLLGLLIFRWARELYGDRAGLLALSLFVIDANLLAHGRLLTTDLYAALAVTLSLYFFWRFQRDGGLRAGFWSALSLGLAQIMKYTSIFLFPVFLLLAAVRHWRKLAGMEGKRHPWWARLQPKATLGYCSLYALVTFLVISAGFIFHKSFTPLGEYEFNSQTFKTIQQTLPAALPIPTPYPYVQGLDLVRERERLASIFGTIYMLGESRIYQEFNGYYFVACLFKTPLPIQVLFIAAAILYWRRRGQFHFSRNEAFLLIPVLFFFIYFNFLYKAQTGIRFLLVAFPLMHIFTASLLAPQAQAGKRARLGIGALLVAGAVSTYSYHPQYLAYFNELVTDRKLSYRILADSNLDWGGEAYRYHRWLEENPGAHTEPPQPTAGTIITGVNSYVGLGANDHLAWMRALDKEPSRHVGYSHLVFEITPEDLERLPPHFRLSMQPKP
jgi:hypothetical protein